MIANLARFTPGERKIADFIINGPDALKELSSQQRAQTLAVGAGHFLLRPAQRNAAGSRDSQIQRRSCDRDNFPAGQRPQKAGRSHAQHGFG
ncbi:hypothetical protein E2L00_13630 [Cedecea colo]|uniref:Uncharacterized protein n=1 Tax=Cedecea colo TaxID=2552946 RepID=A0ABX0VN85_9ENTR|nr:hypothetical protein [Cedecea colo]